MDHLPPIPLDTLLHLPTLPVGLLRPDGTVERSTIAFRRLVLGADAAPGPMTGWSAAPHFMQPRWSDLRQAVGSHTEKPTEPVFEGVLHFGAPDKVARSAECRVLRAGQRWIILAGLDPATDQLAERVVNLNEALGESQRAQARTIRALQRAEAELRKALAEVRTLRGLLPVCAHCRKIRSDEGDWEQIESYVERHTEAEFSHGICEACMATALSELDESDSG